MRGFGDFNSIIPEKLIAFSTPLNSRIKNAKGNIWLPVDYVPIFKKLGVTAVIRLNDPLYDRNDFINHGINHYDLQFTDGEAPDYVYNFFLSILLKRLINEVYCI